MTHSRWLVVGPLMFVVAAAVLLRSQTGDYTVDAGPSLDALLAGDFHRALELQPLMGSFSLIVRAPFAFAADVLGAGDLWIYRAGVIPCIAATAVLGVVLARGRGPGRGDVHLVVPVLAILAPTTIAAVRVGHPEELLTAVLCIGAALLAMEGSGIAAGIVLGLALGTKQWAVLAVLPVLMAAGRNQRLALGLAGAATVFVLTIPLALGNPDAFGKTTHNAATAPPLSTPTSVWFLVTKAERREFDVPAGFPSSLTLYRLPSWAARLSHPLIVLLAVPLTALVWSRRPRYGDALSLLALLFLIRCVLDPVDNEYYHVPLVLSLLSWEAWTGRLVRGIPVVTLATIACIWATFAVFGPHASPQAMNAFYLVWSAALGGYLLYALRLLPERLLRAPKPATG